MKTKLGASILLCTALAVVSFANEDLDTVFDWNFTAAEGWEGDSWQEVAEAGFAVAFERLEQVSDESRNARVYVDARPGYERLRIRIPANEKGLGRGQPVLTYAFPESARPALHGKLSFEAGLTGTDSQSAAIELRSGHSVLLSINLRTGTPRVFRHSGIDDDEVRTAFDAPSSSVYAPMRNRWQKYELTWTVSPDGTNSNATLWVEHGDGGDAPLSVSGVPFRLNGVPDNLRMNVAWPTYGGGAQDREKGMYLNSLKLETGR